LNTPLGKIRHRERACRARITGTTTRGSSVLSLTARRIGRLAGMCRAAHLQSMQDAVAADPDPCHLHQEGRPVDRAGAEQQRHHHAQRAQDIHQLIDQAVPLQLARLQQEERQQHEGHADITGPVVPEDIHRFALRCRRTSNRATPVATETLRLSIAPGIGIFATKSHSSRVRWRMPSPSLPSTSATGPLKSTPWMVVSVSPARPVIHTPASLSARKVRARLVTAISGTRSAPPAEARRTTGVRPTARSFGTITAVTFAAAALRRQAPRLCGSVTPSSTSTRVSLPSRSSRPARSLSYAAGAAS